MSAFLALIEINSEKKFFIDYFILPLCFNILIKYTFLLIILNRASIITKAAR